MIMIFFLDATHPTVIRLGLAGPQESFFKSFELERKLSEKLLPEIEKFLRAKKIKLADLSGIAIARGPGLFSRIRTAVATANALAFALHIPITAFQTTGNEKSQGKQAWVVPIYNHPPRITRPKSRQLDKNSTKDKIQM